MSALPVIVLAGGVPEPGDPLYAYTQGKPKALLDMGGQPMLTRVIAGLEAAASTGEIVVVGLDEPADRAQIESARPVDFLPNQGSIVRNVAAGLAWVADHRPEAGTFIVCSSDIPHLQGWMVDELVEACRPFDRLLYYPVATPETIESRYPDSRRTYTRLKGGVRIAGGDIFIAQTRILDTNHELWEQLTQARKHAWQIARAVGFGTLLRLLFRRMGVEEAAATAGRILGSGQPIGVVFLPHAELAMDGDKPHQIELLRRHFETTPERP